jgi:para-aminobenzoate synthetase / 4-amino-4-deoxychorismate lyase
MRGERIWMGAGGGIVTDSVAERELEECFVKARPVIAAAGARLIEEPRVSRVAPIPALAGGADRPDPALGVFETLLVRAGSPVDARAHLARLERSVSTLYGETLPEDLLARVVAAAAAAPLQRLRLLALPGARVDIEAEPLAAEPAPDPVTLSPAVLPGGLGAHKWQDRRLLDELADRLQAVPLLLDLDGDVLEAAYANVFIVEGTHLVTPPLDGRQLPGTVRARALALHPAREERLSLDRIAAADEVLLASSVRGIHPARLSDGPEPHFQLGMRLRTALREDARGVIAR